MRGFCQDASFGYLRQKIASGYASQNQERVSTILPQQILLQVQ